MEQKDILEDSSLNEKVCKNCEVLSPVSNFRKGRNSCKQCERDYAKLYENKNKEKRSAQKKDYLIRNREKYLAKEREKNNSPERKEYIKNWRLSNKNKLTEYRKKNYENNKDYYNAKNKARWENNKENEQARNKAWREANKEKVKEYRLKRKLALDSNAPKEYNLAFLEYAKAILSGKCAYCDNQATTIEHILPLSKGGLNEPQNIVGACVTCNSSKNNKEIHEFTSMLA